MATEFYVHTSGETPEENTPEQGVPHEADKGMEEQLREMQRTLDAILAAVTDDGEE